ncbi:phosphoglycerate kinase [Helicobacter ailurogastricus]|uniref:Phosphoglycerate kinase n=2 Tax=Helicobacter ailurogastricus TaxID=1578720 RepID=A0A0K2XDH7_9HELI|nr:phosphoglycerate kinase [Helicobacter ailurogastricus]CRF41295.1 Phosphoglycerate kinase [Helicobacter ailurogastricus]CRF42567.1 Phosphoglycerate kinase [Helicobacter ailurogastricus]CRF44587.1 Phosphoglycerate kinase [Helicobacter ailurogastricus]CRF51922.1 Phosphoglycerate kinase [Helicobacter ailurogastricus]GLH57238.1 Phosphoglycerate kinase Pgk [Helicobacter ailurogastricus]
MLAGIKRMQEVVGIQDISVENKRVLIRVDFNVPLDKDFNITEDTRMRESIPTINYCIDNGAKSVVLVGHLGRPQPQIEGQREEKHSFRHLLKRLERLLNKEVLFASSPQMAKDLQESQENPIILVENLRFYKGEKENNPEFAKCLADLCDVYVNDAFGTSHRKHASTYGIAAYVPVKVAGFLLKKEINSFAKALASPLRPVLLVVGGSKVSSKLTLLSNILERVDKVIIGGAMSNTFLKALGYNMQASLVEEDLIQDALEILNKAKQKGVHVYLPVDVVSSPHLEHTDQVQITPAQDIPLNYMAVDIGPATSKLFSLVIQSSQTIIWNGPLGVYEVPLFSRGSSQIAHSISNTYAFSLIGGGDTIDVLTRAGYKDSVSFISTGGGASLELLEGKILVAFEVLDRRP